MLRYLATGDSFGSLHYTFRLGYSTVIKIVHETCESIRHTLFEMYMPKLTSRNFYEISQNYQKRTSYPHIVGAIDGNIRLKV